MLFNSCHCHSKLSNLIWIKKTYYIEVHEKVFLYIILCVISYYGVLLLYWLFHVESNIVKEVSTSDTHTLALLTWCRSTPRLLCLKRSNIIGLVITQFSLNYHLLLYVYYTNNNICILYRMVPRFYLFFCIYFQTYLRKIYV